ncbi:MAG TPA: hypothetical protein PKB12_10735, partial [Elusimicrobiota bacterium]|nr:hypothetical protein [Elusimicrobiota bacterium]
QQGRPVEEIFTEFREHGITILASMIVGFDYQNHAVVAEELAGLMKLKPSLAQFLIYGPVPSTPFYDRVKKADLIRDDYKNEPEKFYRRADGFTTMIKHPTLSPAQIEEIQQWCFDQDFQRLGPSLFRVIESWLLGHQKLKGSPNPLMRQKAEFYAKEIRKAYPIFLAGRLLGPNRVVRAWIAELQAEVHRTLGPATPLEKARSLLAFGMALWTWTTLRFNWFQHPPLTRTEYGRPVEKDSADVPAPVGALAPVLSD